MEAIDMTNSAVCERPFEKHTFRGNGDKFECEVCGRPRAMHLHDGFVSTYRDLDTRIFKPFGRVRPSDRAMGFKGEPKKRRAYRDAGTVIWRS